MPHSTELVATFNGAEAILWFTFAILIVTHAKNVRGMTPRLQVTLASVFTAFGFSDVIETSTGAWWCPPELLALKAAALSAIILTARQLRRARSTTIPPRAEPETATQGRC